jgi:uncharacterized membrane protein YgcG
MMSLNALLKLSAWAALLALTACAMPPSLPSDDDAGQAVEARRAPAPMVEYPPIEPVEPPEASAPPDAPAPSAAASPTKEVPAAQAPAAAPTVVASITPEAMQEEQQVVLLLADLHRYGALPAEEVRREIATVNQSFTRQRTDANRVRLAMLYSLSHANPQDDQRALQLLENVTKSGNGSSGVKQLAGVLQTQIAERVRVVKDEQQKADAAIQKLEALRNMERSLLRERVRGGGGGGTGGGSSGGGGGSGGSAGGN